MLKIRFRRSGRTHDPFYHIVIAEGSMPIQGKYISRIGHYNPKTKKLVLDNKQAIEWMNNGAKPSNSVAKLFKAEKMTHKSIVIHTTRSISKKELAAIKAKEEAEKARIQAEKEAAKEAWEKESEEMAAESPSSDEKLIQEAEQAETATAPTPEEPAEKPTNENETVEQPVKQPEEKK